ncbi:cupin domain-containing protein [Roseobacter weihaiensis]|uniref:cupin domain-containing protein n=1 Tax=Roseobacter weihaiensis TaxID=2763262 RepID=UPI001D0BB6ED|nr:cupin domain-containing protein [Roseobacter sp. H9]
MAIIRKGSVDPVEAVSGYPGPYNLGRGFLSYLPLSDAGGLTQYGASVETLHPGKQSSQMHWHSHEDEFLFVLDGTLTVVENGVETQIVPGDACAWKAGDETAHCLRNHTQTPVRYLIVGTRNTEEDICNYPGLDLKATPDGFVHLDGQPWEDNDRPSPAGDQE